MACLRKRKGQRANHIVGIFCDENFRELLKVKFSQLNLSQIVGNDNDPPIDNDTAVLNENFRG